MYGGGGGGGGWGVGGAIEVHLWALFDRLHLYNSSGFSTIVPCHGGGFGPRTNENPTTQKLFSDPHLYDNLAVLTGDLRLLMSIFVIIQEFLHFKSTVF